MAFWGTKAAISLKRVKIEKKLLCVTVDLLWMAGREAVAEAGALAGPRGWSRDVKQ